MEKPLVSICIPAYNSARYIEKTVRAALKSDWPNLEVLVVDDGSEDETVPVLRRLASEDGRLRVLVNETNLGMTGNWNKCVKEARGEYVKLIPADDLVYPDCLKKTLPPLLKDPEVRLSICGTDLINEEGRVTGSYAHWPAAGVHDGAKVAKASLLFNNFFGNPVCALFRKADFERVGGFDEEIVYILDFDLWLKLASLGKVAFRKEKLSGFLVRNDSNTGRMIGSGRRIYTAEHRRLVEKYREGGAFSLNGAEAAFSVFWRAARNWIILGYMKILARR
ncbi:MAG: glycosyltransferase family 2 protein [Lachnospiraceae bacterium]|nr:glycosyltransferase family 2 protein [Lachnospiraceae bacterium]